MPSVREYEERLAQELIDAVIDCLQNDNTSLASCTLVSRAWLWRATMYLYRRLHGKFGHGSRIADLLCSVKASPRLSLHSQELVLENLTSEYQESNLFPEEVHAILQQLPALRILTIKGFNLGPPSLVPNISTRQISTPPRPRIQKLRIMQVEKLDHLPHILALFSSIQELQLEKVCVSTHSAPMATSSQPLVETISFSASNPDSITSILTMLSTRIVELRLDDSIFVSTELALKCSTSLQQIGSQLNSLHIDLFSGSRSLAVPDAALWGLHACSNLRTITVHAQLSDTYLDNTFTFTVISEIICAACCRAPSTLDGAWLTLNYEPEYHATRPVSIPGLRSVSWQFMNACLIRFSRGRPHVGRDQGIFFALERKEDSDETKSWLEEEFKHVITESLAPEALSILRFS